MEDTFAFIIHPIDAKRDVSRKFPTLGRVLPVWLINFLSLFFPPVYISEVTGVKSVSTGNEIRGWLVACPLTPDRMLSLPPNVVYRKIIQTGRLGERLGARILGLGAFTSVVGDGGITIAKNLNIPVTTGDSYTVAMAVRAIEKAADVMNIPLETATAAVVGGSGSIGRVCAQLLAKKVNKLILIARDTKKLEPVAQEIRNRFALEVAIRGRMSALTEAQLVITVTSALDTIIEPEHLGSGAVICDVSRPRDVSIRVVQERSDILVIEGGMVQVPGKVDFGFDFGFPPQMSYACMAETMALALEKRYESFTLGQRVELSRVMTIDRIAHRHGFTLGGFRSFERAVTDREIEQIKRSVART